MKYILTVLLGFFVFCGNINVKAANNEISQKNFSVVKEVKKQVFKWNMFLNKEVPKKMKHLKDNPSISVILLTMLAAIGYGIIHTLGPGHGKLVVASYFLTQDAKFWHGVRVGVLSSLTHVGGAIALVFLSNVALRNVVTSQTDQVYYMKIVSFSLIIFIGFIMFMQAIRHGFSKKENPLDKKQGIISVAVGLVPCTGSLLILLYAMAHDIMFLGILMAIGVAIGMAITMIGLGILAITCKRKVFNRFIKKSDNAFKYSFVLQGVGACFIMIIGSLFLSSVL